MSEVKWIKLTTTMFEDEKIDFIESLPEADAILIIWIKLLSQAGKSNSNGYIMLTENISYTDEMLAHKFRRPLNVVRLALQTFLQLGMIENQNGCLKISNWEKHQNIDGMDKIREQNRKRVAKHRENQKMLLECNVTCNGEVTPSNAIDIDKDIDIDKEKDKDINIKKHIDSASEIFEFWNEQNGVVKSKQKIDKGKINTAIKTHGKENILAAIKRLSEAVTDESYYYNYKWNLYKFLKQANGVSNWLDDGQLWTNYHENKNKTPVPKTTKPLTKIHNFEQWTDEINKEDLNNMFRDNK